MNDITNAHDQPIGPPVDNWTARQLPSSKTIPGRTCRLERLDITAHSDHLYDAYGKDSAGVNWTYLFAGPFTEKRTFLKWLTNAAAGSDPMFYAIVDEHSNKAIGVAAYMRIDPANGVIEVGNIHFSPALQKTVQATEAMYLMMRHVFDELGYRRYEWKCDALNAPSRRAALRYGFTFEGIFRQALVYKGRNRDTAWFSIIDSEWPAVRVAYQDWLHASNFDAAGEQRHSLGALMQGPQGSA